eukprot:COSAG02_NODE_2016_length_10101_cov_10.944011_3_plen_133_part_00
MKLTLRGLGPVARGAPIGKYYDLVDVEHHGSPRDLAGQVRLELGGLRIGDDGAWQCDADRPVAPGRRCLAPLAAAHRSGDGATNDIDYYAARIVYLLSDYDAGILSSVRSAAHGLVAGWHTAAAERTAQSAE